MDVIYNDCIADDFLAETGVPPGEKPGNSRGSRPAERQEKLLLLDIRIPDRRDGCSNVVRAVSQCPRDSDAYSSSERAELLTLCIVET